MSGHTYKLVYFDAKGRAELARMMFAYAGKDYEDERMQWQDWSDYKSKTPFGQMPVLIVDGKPLAQSGAIYRFLARELGLCGESSLQQAYVDMVHETLNEVIGKLPLMEKDEAIKQKKASEVLKQNIRPILEKFEKKFSENDGDYLVGKNFTYADISFLLSYDAVCLFDKTVMKDYPKLQDLAKRVSELPKIKAWIAKRPKTSF